VARAGAARRIRELRRINTCCIDKSNSNEVNEAINSMYRWYQSAAECYAHLADVQKDKHMPIFERDLVKAQVPAWFTRGWTLQELLAPRKVIFYDTDWQRLGSRKEMAKAIHHFTRIPTSALYGKDPREFSDGDRFSWSAGRKTKKPEDQVYSLFGLFDVCPGSNYGEGKKEALKRLKEAIKKSEMDDTASTHAVTVHGRQLKKEQNYSYRRRTAPSSERSSRTSSPDSLSESWERTKSSHRRRRVKLSSPSRASVPSDQGVLLGIVVMLIILYGMMRVIMALCVRLSQLWRH
jgi:hypothetical protein